MRLFDRGRKGGFLKWAVRKTAHFFLVESVKEKRGGPLGPMSTSKSSLEANSSPNSPEISGAAAEKQNEDFLLLRHCHGKGAKEPKGTERFEGLCCREEEKFFRGPVPMVREPV